MQTQEQLTRGYDALAEVYAEEYCNEFDRKPFDRERLEQFARMVPPGLPLCDLGCGPGHLAAHLKSLGAEVVGIDLSPGMIAEAKRRYPQIEYRVGNMLQLELPDGSLGAIAAFYSMIHIERHELDRATAEMFRVIVAGGFALLAFHGGQGTFHEDETLGKPIPFDCTLYAPEEMASSMERAGFTIDDVTLREPYDFEFPTTRVYVLARK
jgi:ubiquinone/menaquinone biosynthesis C-methylase UbiE